MFPPKGEVMGKKPGFPMLLGQVVPGHHPPPSSLKFGLPIPTTIALFISFLKMKWAFALAPIYWTV